MIQNDEHEYVFVSTMKCGTHTMYELLKGLGGRRVGGFHTCDPRLIPLGYFVFTVCRNPFTRAVSIWWSTCVRDDRYRFRRFMPDWKSFECFAECLLRFKNKPPHILLATQTKWHGPVVFDRYLKLENLEPEFNALPFVQDHVVLPRLNTSTYKDYWEAYTPDAIEMVREWGKEDFEKFGYTTEFPHASSVVQQTEEEK